MQNNNSGFRINQPDVISQTIDDEAVVINLKSGAYYSLTGSAGVIWRGLELGLAPGQIPAWVETHFTDCGVDVARVTSDFLAELQAESLIAPAEAISPAPMPAGPARREIFARPALKKFTDMQELLLLDPIHEVDATGWPHTKPGGAAH